jgi:UDP-N-acetyl-2-amino-2-deoxyglucuronate dehydrogenase
VLNPWNVDAIAELENETGRKVNTILQLRLHPAIVALREKIKNGPPEKIYDIDLRYITSRGHWYHVSWKGENAKAGGIATNIGIHFFDMLIWIFGKVRLNRVIQQTPDIAEGHLELDRARIHWFLSINYDHIPDSVKKSGKRTFRSLSIENEELEFSEGFTDLHTESYKKILAGGGFGVEDARPSIETVYNIRNYKF